MVYGHNHIHYPELYGISGYHKPPWDQFSEANHIQPGLTVLEHFQGPLPLRGAAQCCQHRVVGDRILENHGRLRWGRPIKTG